MKRFVVLMSLALLFSGCASEDKSELVPINKTVSCSKPYISYSGSCCLDINGNGECDYLEGTATTTTSVPGAETQTTLAGQEVVEPANETVDLCSNRIVDEGETGVDCGGSCPPCRTACDSFINETALKPAARTVKLCVSTNDKVGYMNSSFGLEEAEDGSFVLTAYSENGTTSMLPVSYSKDVAYGKTVLRLIGVAKPRTVAYAYFYAWTVEGDIECSTNSDCGEPVQVGTTCVDGRYIVVQYLSYRCTNPGTILSSCQAVQRGETLEVCNEHEMCVNGDPECFPSECNNGILDQDEDEVDCGGASCRPCYCEDGEMDESETGVDCGGLCKPCVEENVTDTLAPEIRITSPLNQVYDTEKLSLKFDSSEDVNCSYSLNGGRLVFTGARRDITIEASPGVNDVALFCVDSSMNPANATQSFTVKLLRSGVCSLDNMSAEYGEHFNETVFYIDDELILGGTERCNDQTFDYASTYAGGGFEHAYSANLSFEMSDGGIGRANRAVIAYECRNTGKLTIAYASLYSAYDPRTSNMRMVVYFNETRPVSAAGSFWRIYSYSQGEEVDSSNYLDVPYAPVASACGNESGMSYQEMDLSSILSGMSGDATRMKLAFYTSMLNSEISVYEIELSRTAKEIASKTKK